MPVGQVSIVGAGPGSADLLTVRAHDRLEQADRVLHDALVSASIIESLPDETVVEDVGKRSGGKRTTQEEINERLVDAAKRGEQVVRLKGGDPTVFGRGGEEAEYLADHGVPFEFVPGVTSAIAGPSALGIPLTHRAHSSSLTVVTGHEDPAKPDSALDWEALARTVSAGGTLVVLMGVSRLPDYVGALRTHGVDRDTPIAMVERATLPGEFAVSGTLADIVQTARNSDIEPPAVTVIGDVVAVGERLADAQEGPAVLLGGDAGAVLEADGGVEAGRLVREHRSSDR